MSPSFRTTIGYAIATAAATTILVAFLAVAFDSFIVGPRQDRLDRNGRAVCVVLDLLVDEYGDDLLSGAGPETLAAREALRDCADDRRALRGRS